MVDKQVWALVFLAASLYTEQFNSMAGCKLNKLSLPNHHKPQAEQHTEAEMSANLPLCTEPARQVRHACCLW